MGDDQTRYSLQHKIKSNMVAIIHSPKLPPP
uniref:Csu474(RpS14) n=1 Tax=Arundo donax TaxID=35708 RepID=A0A0A9F0B4_ARUDO